MDLSETDEEYRLKMDLPGVSKDNLDLKAQNHRLRIQGEREEEAKEEKGDFLRVERSRGSRNVAFPEPADLERAEAEFDNGTLTIHVPKQEEQESTKISIS